MFRIQARKQRGDFTLDVSIEVEAHGVVALFGRSGCGKSTLINVVAGLLRPDAAHIEIDGQLMEDTAGAVRVAPERRRIGYVFQDARLFPHFDVLGNLRYGARRVRDLPVRITTEQVIALLGLQPLLARRVHQLSGGERQRVALGRALLAQPRLLLLDEPLASLDAARREEVLPYLEKLRDELAIPMLYVSHQFDEVLRLASHVVLLEQGQAIAQGALDAISLHPQLRAIVGPDAVGAVLLGVVHGAEPSGLTTVQVGANLLHVAAPNARVGATVRIQLLARDVMLATARPEGVSVRNVLTGAIAQIAPDDEETDLVFVDIGGACVLARVTRAASVELSLQPGRAVWVLVKAVSIRGHAFVSGRESLP